MMQQQSAEVSLAVEFCHEQTIRFRYRNWRGVTDTRSARVIELSYGVTEWHREPQWLLKAFDIEKNAVRLFALSDMVPSE